MFSEADVNIKFSNTTDSGITSTLNYGFDESGNTPAEDLSATMSGDFGAITFDSVGDDGALGGFDGRADKAGEGTNATRTAGTALSFRRHHGHWQHGNWLHITIIGRPQNCSKRC